MELGKENYNSWEYSEGNPDDVNLHSFKLILFLDIKQNVGVVFEKKTTKKKICILIKTLTINEMKLYNMTNLGKANS